ncbi:SPOR domain-containing protein [Acidithiobacillus sp. IBUN Pt1247-S3]|uniref:SPOR domain-containing protein n=1 Tax=Acidithiobacillus sp. IBUN Pt1247-S3 TaxID=3166642 RepID=UPI0034E5FB9B
MTQQSSKNRQPLARGLQWLIILLLLIVIILAFSLYSREPRHASPQSASSVYLQLPQTTTPTAGVESSASVTSTSTTASTGSSASIAKPSSSKTPTQAKVEKAALLLPGTNCEVAGWYVQMGAFAKLSAADELSQAVSKAGLPVCIGNLPNNHLYRVLVGHPQSSRLNASLLAQKIKSAKVPTTGGYPQYWSKATQP